MKALNVALLAALVLVTIPLAGLQGADPPNAAITHPQMVLPAAPVPATPNVLPAPSTTGGFVAPTGPDAWRYTFHNGVWWYWTADNQWLYFTNGQWVALNPAPQPYVSAYGSYDTTPQYVYPSYGGYYDYGPSYGGWGVGFGYGGYGRGGYGHGGFGYGGGHGGHGGHH